MSTNSKLIAIIGLFFISTNMLAQSSLPYREVPENPKEYSAGTVAARLIDGLGFRFYWATDGLTESNLNFKPSEEGRTIAQTVQHIYEMSFMVVNATTNKVNQRADTTLTFMQMREQTLSNLYQASEILKKSDDLENMKIIYEGKNGRVEYPFWNHLNGPIADCLWHVGQIVSMRRTDGNPIAGNLSFFNGKVVE
ncbi:DinB family protein [Fulvivirga lutimaris]|uniref:DinB family protein n=1 Tax=Fulvivirga lutimaris TaxID=1819566 RepID=UPI001C87D3F4|nr:hypothetical protein [Fulvivirga lutimaris]